ncbi:hypothetical protein ABIB68_007977 [Bradyrhizobium sp. F1.2.2]
MECASDRSNQSFAIWAYTDDCLNVLVFNHASCLVHDFVRIPAGVAENQRDRAAK